MVRQQKQLEQLQQEAKLLDDQYANLRKRNQQLINDLMRQKEEVDKIERKIADEEENNMYLKQENQAQMIQQQQSSHRHEDKNVLHEDFINSEIDTICNRTIENYIEPQYLVEHQGNRAVFELKSDNHTFMNIKPAIAQYFALPAEEIFFKNEKDEILLQNLKVLPTLFPLINSKIRGTTPVLKLALKCNMSTLDYIVGDENIKIAQLQEQEEQEQIHQNNLHQSRQRDAARQREQELKNIRERIQRKQRCIQVSIGLSQTAIFLLFFIFQIILTVYQRKVVMSYWGQDGAKNQVFDMQESQVQFNNMTQMLNYIQFDLSRNIYYDPNHFDLFWESNAVLPYIQLQQIRGQNRTCDFSSRPGFSDIYQNQSCFTTYQSGDYNESNFQNSSFTVENRIVTSRGQIFTYYNQGFYKSLKYNFTKEGDWETILNENLIKPNWIDEATLVFMINFNIFNLNTNLMQSFKLIFQFQSSGLITLEYDTIILSAQLFSTNYFKTLSILIYIIGFILLAISIVSMRRQRQQQEKDQKQEKEAEKKKNHDKESSIEGGAAKETDEERKIQDFKTDRTIDDSDDKAKLNKNVAPDNKAQNKKKTCKDRLKIFSLRGVSFFEKINFLMIIFTYLNLGMKYLYDRLFDQKANSQSHTEKYIDLSLFYLFHEAIFIFDSVIIFMMAISIIKYTFFWIPSLSLITRSLQNYLNSTIKKIIQFVFILSFAIASYCHFFYGYVTYGFYDYSFAMIRANLLFLQGNLFNQNTIYLADETIEYIYERQGWFATIMSVGVIHFFGRYVILNIIIAFMKKDIQDTKMVMIKQQKIEKKIAEKTALLEMKQKKKQEKILKRQQE
ncbi:UNKNOWN [Stylonychia lemnae]|uniref:Polycystin domain-containing protein n=1 Tax=Stylonychia lemnae TaxID=5949 RepID=A0A077ZT07_STYLE|nr:UNKNOWN [Stylonychia lemnae]|eukprot:CDW72445.1 UNKNOWN [Stylonychia lemnae]